MPTYLYRCSDCGHSFDFFQKFADDPLTECPECGGPIRRVPQPVGIVFNSPVQVVYNYGARGMDVDPSNVVLVVERGPEWVVMPDRQVFAEEGLVSASALYLSTFCAAERE